MEQLDWRTIGIVWAYCVVWFFIQDIVKVIFYGLLAAYYWSVGRNKEVDNKKLIRNVKRQHRQSLAKSQSQVRGSKIRDGLPIASRPFDPADALMKIAKMEESISLLRKEVLVHASKTAEQYE